MDKFILVTIILQFVSALVLIGISVYYFVTGRYIEGLLFVAVGAFFIFKPARTLYKQAKEKNKKEKPEDTHQKRGFL